MKKLQQLLLDKGYKLPKYGADGFPGTETFTALDQYVKNELTKRKWVMPTDGFVWIRMDQNLTNTFDDFVAVYKGGKCVMAAPASTTAGDTYIFNPITHLGITGTAIACEQQVLRSHRFVTSRTWGNLWTGSPYFQQILPIRIWRDGNRDRILNKVAPQFGLFGINFHRGWLGRLINNASAGCQIVPDADWFKISQLFVANQIIDFTLIEV